MKKSAPAPSWWVALPPEAFYRTVAERAIVLRNAKSPKGLTYSWEHPWRKKPDGNRASVQTEAA